MKFAIVDLGSNTIRLSVYNTLPEGGFDLLFSEKEMAGLVSYVHGGVLSPEGIQRACGAIRDFQALLRQFDLDAPHVFATASLRNIRNTEEAVEQIRAATGVGVDVISGELEARLGYYGAGRPRTCRTAPCSTLAAAAQRSWRSGPGEVKKAQSLPIGSLELFNRCVDGLWPKKKELERIRSTVAAALKEAGCRRTGRNGSAAWAARPGGAENRQ